MSSFSILKSQRKTQRTKTLSKSRMHDNVLTLPSLPPPVSERNPSITNMHDSLHPVAPKTNLHAPTSNSFAVTPLPQNEIIIINEDDDVNFIKDYERKLADEQADKMMEELSALDYDEFDHISFDFNDGVDSINFNQFSSPTTTPFTMTTSAADNIAESAPIVSSSPSASSTPSSIPNTNSSSSNAATNIPTSAPIISSSPSLSSSSSLIPTTSTLIPNTNSTSPTTPHNIPMSPFADPKERIPLHHSSEDAFLTKADKEELKKWMQIEENKHRQRPSFLCTTEKYIRLQKSETKLKIKIKYTHEEIKKLLRKLNAINRMKMIEINSLTK